MKLAAPLGREVHCQSLRDNSAQDLLMQIKVAAFFMF
jgi:hypothetical protein